MRKTWGEARAWLCSTANFVPSIKKQSFANHKALSTSRFLCSRLSRFIRLVLPYISEFFQSVISAFVHQIHRPYYNDNKLYLVIIRSI